MDSVGDELRPLKRRGAVALVIGCAVSDNVAFVQLASLEEGGAVIGGSDSVEAAGGPQIDFYAPFAVALAEVKAAAVDLPVPLFRTRAVVAVYKDPVLVGEPGLKLGFAGLLEALICWPSGDCQKALMSPRHCRNARWRSSGVRAHTESNP